MITLKRLREGGRDMSARCLWVQDGGRKCQPSDGLYCLPCLEDFWADGSVARPQSDTNAPTDSQKKTLA